MTDILTKIELNGATGLMEWGRCNRQHMIKLLREKAARDKAEAERILAAADSEFDVRIVRGVHVQRLVQQL